MNTLFKLGIAHHEILLQFLACTGSSISVVIVQVGNMRTGMLSMVSCTWWLLGLALKRSWSVPSGPPPALTAWTSLENTILTL